MAWQVSEGIERGHLRSTEQGMIELAATLAGRWPDVSPETMQLAARSYHQIFGEKNAPDLRLVLVNGSGTVLSDSSHLYKP